MIEQKHSGGMISKFRGLNTSMSQSKMRDNHLSLVGRFKFACGSWNFVVDFVNDSVTWPKSKGLAIFSLRAIRRVRYIYLACPIISLSDDP
jgi:hypothetical protein